MDREELERRRIMAVLEESDSNVMPSDQESGEDDDHVSERVVKQPIRSKRFQMTTRFHWRQLDVGYSLKQICNRRNMHQQVCRLVIVRSHGNILVKMVRLGFKSLFDRMFEQELKI
ncbi:hypothetical protein HHI36_023341 [Cryptolaemus montrouzieri]|uniref:Uncharacterized protein n=1 Tax=Cryptolaemus montrouzieri TaxID=559131 RepID=A0ABD2PGG2_9CUCU